MKSRCERGEGGLSRHTSHIPPCSMIHGRHSAGPSDAQPAAPFIGVPRHRFCTLGSSMRLVTAIACGAHEQEGKACRGWRMTQGVACAAAGETGGTGRCWAGPTRSCGPAGERKASASRKASKAPPTLPASNSSSTSASRSFLISCFMSEICSQGSFPLLLTPP